MILIIVNVELNKIWDTWLLVMHRQTELRDYDVTITAL